MPSLWSTDQELFELARAELFTAVVGDIMDTIGNGLVLDDRALQMKEPQVR